MAQEKHAHPLETEPVGKLLMQYSLPAIASMVAYSLYNIIDSIFIGHGVGPLAISGLAITFPIMNLTFAFSLLVGIGGATVSAIRLGERDEESAGKVLGNVLTLSLVTGIVLGLLTLLILDPLLVLFGASTETLPYARDFMQILLPGLPLTYVMSNLNQQMRASGYPQKALVTVLVSVVVNLALAPLFIFVFHWGIRGAALATILAQCAGLFCVLHHFFQKGSLLHFRPGIYRLEKPIVSVVLTIGLPPFLVHACACLVVVLINAGLKKYGGDLAIGAYGIVNRILIFLVTIVIGLNQGMQPLLGYNHGAKRPDRVALTLRYGLIAGTAITTAGFLVAQLFPTAIAKMFTTDGVLIAQVVTGLHIMTAVFPLAGAQIVVGSFFQAIGQARLAIFLSVARQLLFLVPCLLLFPNLWGLNGIWISIPVADTLAFLAAIAALRWYAKESGSALWRGGAPKKE